MRSNGEPKGVVMLLDSALPRASAVGYALVILALDCNLRTVIHALFRLCDNDLPQASRSLFLVLRTICTRYLARAAFQCTQLPKDHIAVTTSTSDKFVWGYDLARKTPPLEVLYRITYSTAFLVRRAV